MLVFATSLFVLLLTPGPGVLSLAGVGAAFGYRSGWTYGVGLFVGSNFVMLVAALGLAAMFETHGQLRLTFVVLSSAYLIYLASRVALAGSGIAFIEATRSPGVWDGVVLQVFNPKAYAVGTFVFSNFPFWPHSFLVEAIWKFLILNLVWVPIHIAWLSAGIGIQRLDLPQGAQRAINIAMAVAMVAVVAAAMLFN